jgi:hypothetical protein
MYNFLIHFALRKNGSLYLYGRRKACGSSCAVVALVNINENHTWFIIFSYSSSCYNIAKSVYTLKRGGKKTVSEILVCLCLIFDVNKKLHFSIVKSIYWKSLPCIKGHKSTINIMEM